MDNLRMMVGVAAVVTGRAVGVEDRWAGLEEEVDWGLARGLGWALQVGRQQVAGLEPASEVG